MLTLLLGRSGTGKTDYILSAAAQNRTCTQIIIVPEQYSHDTERALCRKGGSAVSQYAEVLSFSRLAGRVFAVSGGLAVETLDQGGRTLLMRLAVQSVSDQLRVFSAASRKPAFLQGMLATVDELKSYCVTPNALFTAGEESGASGEKLRDMGLIFGAYDALTARQGADPRDRLTRLADALHTSGWAGGKAFYLDSFTDFTPQEQAVLARLLEQAAHVTVSLTCDHAEETEDGTGIFSAARRTAQKLIRLAARAGTGYEIIPLEQPRREKEAALSHMERALFAQDAALWVGEADGLCLYEAPAPYAEVEYVAAEILRLVREEGYRFRDIAVTAGDMTEYAALLELVFARYEIPLFLSRMEDIMEKPVMAFLSAALHAVTGGYRYEQVITYLKTGLSGLSREESELLENYAYKWEIRGSRWTQKASWNMHPRGFGLPMTERDQALVMRLDTARRALIEPLERLRRGKDQTGRGHALALYRFFIEIDFPNRLTERAGALKARGALALSEEYLQLWEIVCGALDQAVVILSDTPMELEEFAGLFTLVLSQYDVGSIPVSLDRVQAGEMPRLAHKPCRALFFLGADDGAVPRVTAAPGLLNEDDRTLLASFGMELAPGAREKLPREMTILYETCALPSSHFSLSWSHTGGDGGERQGCFLVRQLLALFPSLTTDTSAAPLPRLAAPRPALELAGRIPAVYAALTQIPQYAPQAARLDRCKATGRGALTRPMTEALYGVRVPMSASRMDRFQACHFSYFMQYGLRAEARRSAGFQAPEYGTFMHYVLEHVFRTTLTPDRALVQSVVDRYVAEELGGLEAETPRFRYLFRRLIKSVYAVVENVAEELAASDFTPLSFELGFREKGDLPPVEIEQNGITVSISGFVDRVDGWVKGDKLYLRVVDYKTGRKSFNLTDIWNGMGMQMLLYLFTLQEKGGTIYGKEIVPAGVLYLPARDAVVAGSSAMTDAERRRKVDRELCRKGLILDDPDVLAAMEHIGEGDFRFLPVRLSKTTGAISGAALVDMERMGKLQAHTAHILQEIGTELAAGNITADPFWRSKDDNACHWCDYAAACHFEDGSGADHTRYLTSMRGEHFWESLSARGEAQEGDR
ncbi:MAG: exodeoxyribonuclease V subunit gamma [Oscillospiraceae bacterium]|nr:exodeoxyribonuclease V subunit gamma [Oscillospiraceae bacterium]